jgi:phosphatidylethanolamine/phosphatidyl-N-methylethanolamine N-methyltransferase
LHRIFAGVSGLSRSGREIGSMTTQATVHAGDLARVQRTWARLAPVYDFVYGAMLQPGRRRAVARMVLGPGERVLEIGVGTGIGLELYPRWARVTGIDLSRAMLDRARSHVGEMAARAYIDLREMDAASMTFADGAFDVVYAPYILNVVPNPIAVASEMRRVCRPGGRIILLNRFRSEGHMRGWIDDVVSNFSALTGTRWNLPMRPFLTEVPLFPISIERVNIAGFSSLMVCRR